MSASSARLFPLRTKLRRFGTEFDSVACIAATRLFASRSVVRRGESGKLPRIWTSLSVKSMQSCGYRSGQRSSSLGRLASA